MVSDSREYVQYMFIYFCFWCEYMCAPVHVDVCVNPGQGAVESLALSCCCRDTAVALATAALCKYNYRADTVWHPNWGTLTVFMILVCLLLFASVCHQMSPRPVYLTLALYWKHWAKFGVYGQKWLGFWKCFVNILLILYYHQILDLIFLSTCFLPINTDLYLWTVWS